MILLLLLVLLMLIFRLKLLLMLQLLMLQLMMSILPPFKLLALHHKSLVDTALTIPVPRCSRGQQVAPRCFKTFPTPLENSILFLFLL